jgi:S-formylglutathione hydrolase FrmB
MVDWWSAVSIVDGPLFVGSFLAAGLLAAALLVPRIGLRPASASPAPSRFRRSPFRVRRFLPWVLATALAGALAGAVITWLLSDVVNVFGLSLTWVVRIADTVACAAFGIALANLLAARWWRAALAVISAALTAWCLFLAINVDFGQYPTLGDALGTTYQEPLELPQQGSGTPITEWTPPAQLPAVGVVGTVAIPATKAEFSPRTAAVYLPPAALVADPPALPVVIALSGQPGTPADLFSAGGLDTLLDSIARDHDGVAPIVVVPDQLGDPSRNPMCIDGAEGDSATYLTEDVPDWIRANLPASTDRRAWTIAGFSQGGTCSIQLGAGRPDLFGSIVDVSGEVAPSLGSREKTIGEGFAGDSQAYEAATPEGLLEAGAPFRDSVAYFIAGANDRQYSAYMQTVSAAAERAGMSAVRAVSPSTGHDYNTARYGFALGFAGLLERWGIEG